MFDRVAEMGIQAGRSEEEAKGAAAIWSARAMVRADQEGITPEEWFNRALAGIQREDFATFESEAALFEPINADVDLDAEVDVVDIDLGQYIDAQLSTPEELLNHVKKVISKEGRLSADSKARLEISSNSTAKHFVWSSWKGQTQEENDARNAALLSIDDIVKNAVLIESFPNQDTKKSHLKNVHRLYVPLQNGDSSYVLRVVGHETKDKSGFTPIEAELFDLIVERETPDSQSLTGSPLSRALPEPTKNGGSKITIREMLRGVNDAQGNPYVFEQNDESAKTSPRGAFDPAVRIIYLFERADASTLLHETGHAFLKDFQDFTDSGKADTQSQSDWSALAAWLGSDGKTALTREQHEQFARGVEAYLREGTAPSVGLRSVIEQFKKWLIAVYRNVEELNVDINYDVRGVFDRMLAAPGEIAENRIFYQDGTQNDPGEEDYEMPPGDEEDFPNREEYLEAEKAADRIADGEEDAKLDVQSAETEE
ncbi:MAG: hypothetical protein LBO82_02610, partial [Synergistaceae bacterium]|nr:hypothetical protein [Synergistaceae bacterium]